MGTLSAAAAQVAGLLGGTMTNEKPSVEQHLSTKRKRRKSHIRKASKAAGEGPAPFVLRFEKCNLRSPLADITSRFDLYIGMIRSAILEDNRACGIKLRKSSKIVFDYYPALGKEKIKVVTRHRSPNRVTPGSDIEREGEELGGNLDKPWLAAARQAIKIIKAMKRFAKWVDTVETLAERVKNNDLEALEELPDRYPKMFFATYVKPLFGDETRQVWRELAQLRDDRRRKAAIHEILEETQQPTTAEVIQEVASSIVEAKTESNTETS